MIALFVALVVIDIVLHVIHLARDTEQSQRIEYLEEQL